MRFGPGGEILLKGYLAASLRRDAVWPALPLYLPEAKVRIAAQCSHPTRPIDLIGSGRSRTDEQ